MATLRELVVSFKLEADTKAIKRLDDALGDLKTATMDLVSWGAKLVGTYMAFGGALAANSAKAADFAEEVMRSASAFGITTAKFQEQLFAMQALGASADDLADAYSTLSERAIQAQEGSKTYRKEFKRLGISIDELKGKDPGQLFDLYIQKSGEMTNATQRSAASAALLGDDLGRRISRGVGVAGSSFDDYIQILRTTGGVFNDEMLERAQQAQIQFRLLGATFSVLRKRIGLELAPVFGDFAARIVRWFRKNTDSVLEFVRVLKEGVQRELIRLEFIAKKVDSVVQRVFGGWTNLAKGLAVALAGVAVAITGAKIAAVLQPLIIAFKALAAVGLSTLGLIGLILIVLGALGLAFEDLWVEVNGGDSVIGNLIDRFDEMGGVLATVAGFWLKFVRDQFRELSEEWDKLVAEAGPAVISMLKFLGALLVGVVGAAIVGVVGALILLGRILVFAARFIFAFGEAFIEVMGWILTALTDPLEAVNQLVDAIKELARFSGMAVNVAGVSVDPAVDAVSEDFDASLDAGARRRQAVAEFFGGGRIREEMLGSELASPDAFAAQAGGPRGEGGGSRVASQTNQFDVKVEANSADEGREAARGFKEEIEKGGFASGLRAFFEAGEI